MRLVHAALLVGVTACGGAPKPEARLESSQAAIRGAEEVGAKDSPQAALHLQLAVEQREKAIQLIRNEENGRAERLLMRAEADAELAVALAREASARSEAQKMKESIDELKRKVKQ
jgi:hypothetical protein